MARVQIRNSDQKSPFSFGWEVGSVLTRRGCNDSNVTVASKAGEDSNYPWTPSILRTIINGSSKAEPIRY